MTRASCRRSSGPSPGMRRCLALARSFTGTATNAFTAGARGRAGPARSRPRGWTSWWAPSPASRPARERLAARCASRSSKTRTSSQRAYACATPAADTGRPDAAMSFPAGPETASLPTIGLMATVVAAVRARASSMPGTARIGPDRRDGVRRADDDGAGGADGVEHSGRRRRRRARPRIRRGSPPPGSSRGRSTPGSRASRRGRAGVSSPADPTWAGAARPTPRLEAMERVASLRLRALSQEARPVQMSGEVAVAQREPRRLAERRHVLEGVKRLVAHAPALSLVDACPARV